MQTNGKRKIPELLSPGGGIMQLRAAVENGADAVYIGGKLFNARINADNFDMQDTKEAVEYCHKKGVRLYVTLNTLLGDNQLEEAINYGGELYRMGVDAFIIQDLGLGQLLREAFPGITLHLSTQGTVYNLEGVTKAKQLGYKRVVLARETTLEEIQAIHEQSDAELEVFIHGALCICYSGQCEMSFEIGGRSGNRGACGQPCRLPYELYEEAGGKLLLKNNSSYLLSPKDLATIDILDKVIESGVSSLKIEGRMKSPEYVAIVTKIYRKYLDDYKNGIEINVEPKDLEQLNQVFNRGGFTSGYFFDEKPKDLITQYIPKHQGVKIGNVVASEGQALVCVKLERHLNLGDGVEIRNEHLPGNIVTFMQKNGRAIKRAEAGETVVIGDIKGTVKKGEEIFKITDKYLMMEARKTYENKSSSNEKYLKKIKTKVSLKKVNQTDLKLEIVDESGLKVTVEEACLSKEYHAVDHERLKQQLSKSGGTIFEVENCEIASEEEINVAISKINQLRRECFEKLEKARINSNISESKFSTKYINGKEFLDNNVFAFEKRPESIEIIESFYLFQEERLWETINNINEGKKLLYLPIEIFFRNAVRLNAFKDKVDVVPVVGNVSKGKADQFLRNNFDEIVNYINNNTFSRSISIGNVGWIDLFLNAGLKVRGDFGLNACNSADFKLYANMGLESLMVSHELSIDDIINLNFHGITPEVCTKGRTPVMFIESDIIGTATDYIKVGKSKSYLLKDRKGEYYQIFKDDDSEKTVIFNFKGKLEDKYSDLEKIYFDVILRTYI